MLRKSIHNRHSIHGSSSPNRGRKSLLSVADSSDDSTLPQNDDEAERQERRRQNEIRQRESLGGLSEKRVSLGSIADFSAAELVAHYTNCIKLSTENKINPKNAFSLQLIDYMSMMLKKRDSSMNNFQVASCTLDASTKIYASRVDRVHMDVLKMAGGLGIRTGNRKKKGDGEEEEEEGEEDNEDDGGKVKRTKKRKKRLIKPPESLNAEVEQDFRLDPMYIYMQSDFGDCQPGFLNFLPRINVHGDSYQLAMFPSSPFWSKKQQNCERISMDTPTLPDELSFGPNLAFRGLFLGGNSGDTSNFPSVQTQSTQLEPDVPMDLDMPEPDQYDDETFMGDADVEESVGPPAACRPKEPAANILDVRQHLSMVPLEYSYFNMDKLSLWAGPSHWKINRGKDRNLETEKKPTKPRKRKDLELKYEKLDDLDVVFVPGRAIKLLKRTMEQKWSIEKVTTPIDVQYDAHDLTRLFLRKCVQKLACVANKAVHEQIDDDDDDAAKYDYDNVNDSQDFCPSFMECNDEGAPTDDLTVIPSQDVHNLQDPGVTGWKLVTPPPKVARIYIPYALVAKKVDMRRMKLIMWELLTDKEINKENSMDWDSQSTSSSLKPDSERRMQGSVRFSNMYQELRKRLPSRMAHDLSVSLAFSALLHLANEMQLKIIDQLDHADLTITQPSV